MELKDYNVGVYFGRPYSGGLSLYCSCGHFTQLVRGEAKVCAKCGNAVTVNGGDSVSNRRIYDGVFTCVEKDDRSFHLKKQEIIIHFDSDSRKTRFKHIHDWELKYDMRHKTAVLTKDGKEVTCSQSNHNNILQFFKCATMSERELIPVFATRDSQHLYEFAYRKLGSQRQERVNKLGRALMRLLYSSSKLELFFFAGFGQSLESIYGQSWMGSSETKPHKILGVPKYLLNVLRGIVRFTKYDVERLASLDTAVGGNNVKLAIDIFKEESDMSGLLNAAGTIKQLYDDYGYKDVKRLSLYLAREVKLEQGISSPSSAANLLRDYVRMCKEMEVAPKEKFPKSLKKMHDIAQMNYKVNTDEAKNKKMKDAVDSEHYQALVYAKKPYTIITPRDASDLIKEGSSLSHCVASYVNDVIDNKCKILFLRDDLAIDEPLVTIEVREDNIRQVRGFGNRSALPLEMEFVREWAEKKQLNLSTY